MVDRDVDDHRPVVTRDEARANGLKRFYTGKPCKHSHFSERFTSNGICVECSLEYQRSTYASDPKAGRARAKSWREANPEKAQAHYQNWSKGKPGRHRELKKKYYWRDREQNILVSKQYYAENSEACKWRARKRYAEKRDEIIAYVKQWGKNNPDKLRAIQRTRKARKKGADGSHSAEDIQRIRDLQKDRCAICRKPLKAKGHVDHITPLAKGGSNWPSNLQLLCGRCNKLKSARDPIDFMQSLGKLL